MQDEPTIGEQLRTLGAQLTRVEARMSELVSRERYDFQVQADEQARAALAERIGKIEAASEKARDDQVQTRRMVWTAFLIPLGLVLLQFYLSSWSK
jgi:uncharacterized protein involved in exopolysaccharide biosynthesis